MTVSARYSASRRVSHLRGEHDRARGGVAHRHARAAAGGRGDHTERFTGPGAHFAARAQRTGGCGGVEARPLAESYGAQLYMPGADRPRHLQRRRIDPAAHLQYRLAGPRDLAVRVLDEGIEIQEAVGVGAEPAVVLVHLHGVEGQRGDDARAPAGAENAMEAFGVMVAPAGTDAPVRIDVLEVDDLIDEHAVLVRGRAHSADGGESARGDIAMVTHDRQTEPVRAEPPVDLGQPSTGLHPDRAAPEIDIEHRIHPAHRHHGALIGHRHAVVGQLTTANGERFGALTRIAHGANDIRGVTREMFFGGDSVRRAHGTQANHSARPRARPILPVHRPGAGSRRLNSTVALASHRFTVSSLDRPSISTSPKCW